MLDTYDAYTQLAFFRPCLQHATFSGRFLLDGVDGAPPSQTSNISVIRATVAKILVITFKGGPENCIGHASVQPLARRSLRKSPGALACEP